MKEIKEIRNLNIVFARSGSGSYYTKINLPKKWIDEMNLSIENRSVKVSFDGEKIIIEKSI